MNKKIILLLFVLMFFGPILTMDIGAVMTSDNGYQIWEDTISVGGGEDSASDSYILDDTLGEQGIGRSSSTNYSARMGFREMIGGENTLTLNVSPTAISFGNLSKESTKAVSHDLTIGTDYSSGVSVSFSGSTLTCPSCSGTNTISGIGSSAVSSSVGSSQFGFNINYSGGSAPIASALAPYNMSDQYAFSSGDQIISSSGSINDTTFNVNYIANISGDESIGSYSTAITFTAVANL